jgi:hypothetical protein
MEGTCLICPFTETEVKSALWDCDGYKSPGPDDIPLGFIKDFWPDLKGDVMQFVSEFYRNGRLSKGINSTFIALIPVIVLMISAPLLWWDTYIKFWRSCWQTVYIR